MDKLLERYKDIQERYELWWQGRGSIVNVNVSETNSGDGYQLGCFGPEWYERYHTDPKFNAEENRKRINETPLIGDTIPVAMSDYGVNTLASYFGCDERFAEDTIWYDPFLSDDTQDQILSVDPDNKWWKVHLEILNELKKYDNEFFVGLAALTQGIDCLFSVRGSEIMSDFYTRPAWVHEKLKQIQSEFFKAFDLMYDLTKREDGSMVFGYFSLWGKGKTTQTQCDISAMISPGMFDEFVMPYLTDCCDRMEKTLYHLDGTQAAIHLPSLLSIKSLNAIEWSPQSSLEGGGNPRWYELYEKILSAGKALQVVESGPEETVELFRHFGSAGLYVMTTRMSRQEAERMLEQLEKYR